MPGTPEDDDDMEEEEYLVHVEFDGLLDSNILDRPNVFFKIIGIDSEKPILQIEEQVYTGEYRDVVGTAVFFEEDPNSKVEDPVFGSTNDKQLRYVCKTRKCLLMSRVFLSAKEGKEGKLDSVEEEEGEIVDTVDILEDESSVEEEVAEDSVCSDKNVQSTSNEDSSVDVFQGCSIEPMEALQVQPVQVVEERGSIPESTLLDISRSVSNPMDIIENHHNYEPVAGPSWAPDIPDLQLNVMQGSSFEKSADHVSRLIAEQMTIASDIDMQNVLQDSDETSD